jgi:hypothetical protein
MQEQDEDLVQIIRELQIAKGRGEVFDPRILSEKIEMLGPPIELSALRSNIFAEIVDELGVSWDEMFGRLLLFRDNHTHCRVPRDYIDRKLAKWVSHQRTFAREGTLSSSRKQLLNEIGFEWNPLESHWGRMFGCLLEFRKCYQHCRVPPSYGDGTLAPWCEKNRAKKKAGTLKKERELALDEIGFDWDPTENRWQDFYARLVRYREVHGHCCPPRSYEDRKLTNWIFGQRTKNKLGKLSDERKRMLDEIEFVFDVREASWLENYQQLKSFFEQHGHSNVPQSDKFTKMATPTCVLFGCVHAMTLSAMSRLWSPLWQFGARPRNGRTF